MKLRYWIIIIVIVYLLGGVTWALIDYNFFPCPDPNITIEIGPENKPIINNVSNPYSCGPTIHIDGTMMNDVLRAKAYNNCMSNFRDFKIKTSCPPPWITFNPGIITGVGNDSENKRIDYLIGGHVSVYGHKGQMLAYGGGLWYMQNVSGTYKAGGIKADLLCTFKK